MQTIEAKVAEFAKERRDGILVGFAGPERLDGPPSLDPSYTMRGAKSIVSIAVPMHVPAIYDFLSKKSPVPHNVDQARGNQEVFRITNEIATFLRSHGHGAKAARVNSDYRPSLDTITFHPAFSHRLGALASGIAGQGWSGNVVTAEYGAAVYLGTVVVDAELTSSPRQHARKIVEERCSKCKMCEKSCPVGMFEREREEQTLLCGELYPRGKRRNVDLCTASCFGMHALSRDKKWTSWGEHWIDEWIDGVPEPENRAAVRRAFVKQVSRASDSGMRATLIQRLTQNTVPKRKLDLLPDVDAVPEDKDTLERMLNAFGRAMGLPELKNTNVLTCGQCAMVCGPTLKERGKRFQMLAKGGFVVKGEDGAMVKAKTFDEARTVQRLGRRRASAAVRARDAAFQVRYSGGYFGFDLRSALAGWLYERRRRRALQKALRACAPPAVHSTGGGTDTGGVTMGAASPRGAAPWI